MFIDFLFDVFRQNAESEAVIWRDQSFAYGKLLNRTNQWRSYLRKNRIAAGAASGVRPWPARYARRALAVARHGSRHPARPHRRLRRVPQRRERGAGPAPRPRSAPEWGPDSADRGWSV